MKTGQIQLVLVATFFICSLGCARQDIVLFGAEKTDNFPRELKSWQVSPCSNSENCQRLTDPLANCRVTSVKIECANHHIYQCGPGARWHSVNLKYHQEMFCSPAAPKKLPQIDIPSGNF